MGDSEQETDELFWSQLFSLENGPRIDVVNAATLPAAVVREMCPLCPAKTTGVIPTREAMWAPYACRMQKAHEPYLAGIEPVNIRQLVGSFHLQPVPSTNN